MRDAILCTAPDVVIGINSYTQNVVITEPIFHGKICNSGSGDANQPAIGTDPDCPRRVLRNRIYPVVGHSLPDAENFKSGAIKPIESGLGSDPQIAIPILKQSLADELRESLFSGVIAKCVLLCKAGRNKKQKQQNAEARDKICI